MSTKISMDAQFEHDRRRLQDLVDDADHGREVYICSLGISALRRLLARLHHDGAVPLSYVTSEGVVRVPDEVRKALGLEHGGGVFFVPEKDDQHYRMLTNAQFWDLFEPRTP